jgi:hypothetical protein
MLWIGFIILLFIAVLIFCGFYNKLVQTWGLKTTKFNFLLALKIRSLKSVLLGIGSIPQVVKDMSIRQDTQDSITSTTKKKNLWNHHPWAKSRCYLKAMFPWEAPRENPFLASPTLWWLCTFLSYISLITNARGFKFHFFCSNIAFSALCIKCPSASLLFRHLWLYLGPTHVIRVNFPISRSLITYMRTFSPIKMALTSSHVYFWLSAYYRCSAHYLH